MNTIKFIYFDIGGVLLIDFHKTNKWEELKNDLKLTTDEKVQFDQIWKNNAQRVCLDYNVDLLIPIYEREVKIKFPHGYSLLSDIINRFELNPSIWQLVNHLKPYFKLGIISNMYPRMLETIRKRKLIPDVVWDQVIDSSKVGIQKPDPKIYKLAQEKTKYKPSEILFIDNLEINLEPARERGWQTFLYNPSVPELSTKQLRKLCI